MKSSSRTQVDNVVGGTHHILIMFNDDYGIAKISEPFQALDKAHVVTLMQTYAGLIKDIQYVD